MFHVAITTEVCVRTAPGNVNMVAYGKINTRLSPNATSVLCAVTKALVGWHHLWIKREWRRFNLVVVSAHAYIEELHKPYAVSRGHPAPLVGKRLLADVLRVYFCLDSYLVYIHFAHTQDHDYVLFLCGGTSGIVWTVRFSLLSSKKMENEENSG